MTTGHAMEIASVCSVVRTDPDALLIMHGEDDRRVLITHSEKMMKAMDANHKVYEWISFCDEGHGLRYIKNLNTYYEALFKFLDKFNPTDSKPALPAVAAQ